MLYKFVIILTKKRSHTSDISRSEEIELDLVPCCVLLFLSIEGNGGEGVGNVWGVSEDKTLSWII